MATLPEDCYEKVWVPRDAVERLRNAVAKAQEEDPTISLAKAIGRGCALVTDEFKVYHNDGREFPRRDEALRPGRRPKKKLDHIAEQ